PRPAGRSGGHRPVPPRGRPRPTRRPVSVRPLPGVGGGVRWPPDCRPLEGSIVALEPIAATQGDDLRAVSRADETWTWLDRDVPGSDEAFSRWFEARLAASQAGEEWCF